MALDGSQRQGYPSFEWLTIFFSGLCMGAADIVPGISGGTVAFIMGIYPGLLESLKSFNAHSLKLLVCLEWREFHRSVKWQFLLALVGGIAVSFLTLAQVFHHILGDEVYRTYLYAAFLGLIIASIGFCARQLHRWRAVHFGCLLIGASIAFAFTGTQFQKKSEGTYYRVSVPLSDSRLAVNYAEGYLLDISESILSAMLAKAVITPDTFVQTSDKSISGRAKDFVNPTYSRGLDPWIICCGAIAISAMLLPGISGSYLLTILGMYGVVIAALADFVGGLKRGVFETDAFFVLSSMMIGIVIGALLFSRVVSWLLKHYHDGTVSTLTGFMVGALGAVWPFWSYTYYYLPLRLDKGPQLEPLAPIMPDMQSAFFLKACAFAVIGFLAVFLLERLASSKSRQ